MPASDRQPVVGFVVVLVAASLFGMLGPLSRFAYDAGMEPLSFVGWRGAIGLGRRRPLRRVAGHARVRTPDAAARPRPWRARQPGDRRARGVHPELRDVHRLRPRDDRARPARLLQAAIEAGASGFLLKDAEADDLAAAIRAARAGEVYLDPAVAGIVARRMRTRGARGSANGQAGDGAGKLTARERDVLACVARGLSNRAIAEELGIAERTARTHVSNTLAKLGLTSRTQAALFAVEHRLAGGS